MSMTLEEAIKNREECLRYLEDIGAKATPSCVEAVRWSVKALKALRPITREQVEKMRGRFFQAGIDDVAQDTWRCSRCLVQEFGNIQGINFCPSCGAPMTDKAVDMVMERLEVLKDGN